MKRYLIIGNGVAGTTAAENIRQQDDTGEITILTDENFPFYYRIRLNEYISGDVNEQNLYARKPEWYDEKKITLKTGIKVTEADPQSKCIITDDNQKFPYDCLLIATGSKSFIPPIQGADKRGVFTLRSIDDANQIRAYSENIDRVVLIGGGLLGLEAGNALRKKGKKITVVEFFPRLLPRQLDDRGAGRLQTLMEGMGFSFHLGATTKEITGVDTVESVILENGETIPCDMVIISAGVRPNLELGQCLDLKCERGIVVDSSLRTSCPEVFAAGDVAEYENMMYGIWPAAMQQGKSAGINMAGGEVSYNGSVMANKLKVVGIELASAGEIDTENRYESRVEETDTTYKKIVIKDNCIIGCIMIGDTSHFHLATKAISEKTAVENVKI